MRGAVPSYLIEQSQRGLRSGRFQTLGSRPMGPLTDRSIHHWADNNVSLRQDQIERPSRLEMNLSQWGDVGRRQRRRDGERTVLSFANSAARRSRTPVHRVALDSISRVVDVLARLPGASIASGLRSSATPPRSATIGRRHFCHKARSSR